MLNDADQLKFHPDASRARKRPVVHYVKFAEKPGVCITLEGEVSFGTGDAIVTGVKGEQWPIARRYFDSSYEPVKPTISGEPGAYRKRPVIVWVKQLTTATTLHTHNRALHGAPGDWLVEYEPGDCGVVRADIFSETYEMIE